MKLVFLTAVGLYIFLLAALYLFQRSVLYHPDPNRPEPAQFGVGEMEAVTLKTEDGLDLLAWWRPPGAGDAPVMVFFHGNAGHIGYRGEKMRPYLRRGWGVLLVAWRGYSGNAGSPTEEGLYADGRAALAFLDGRGVRPSRRVAYGESLGAAVAVELARRTRFGAVVLEAPFTSVADVAQKMYPIFPVRLLVRDRFATIDKIGEMRSPLLVVHGEADKLIPVGHGRRLHDAAPEPKSVYVVPGGGHNNLHSLGISDQISAFVEKHLGAK
jgi:fermentation-respiration switch protein FrsA (DUF1100 family)